MDQIVISPVLTRVARESYSVTTYGHDYSKKGKGRRIQKPFPHGGKFWVCDKIASGLPERQPEDPPNRYRVSITVYCLEAIPLEQYTGVVAEDVPFSYSYIPMTDPDGKQWILTEDRLAITPGEDIFEEKKLQTSSKKKKDKQKAPVKEKEHANPPKKPKPEPKQLDLFGGS
jgi:hypothetical protein